MYGIEWRSYFHFFLGWERNEEPIVGEWKKNYVQRASYVGMKVVGEKDVNMDGNKAREVSAFSCRWASTNRI